MSDAMHPVILKIAGKEYKISCTAESEEQLILFSEQLDAHIRKIKLTGKVTGDERIAIMAALNLADHLSHPLQEAPDNQDISEKLKNMDIKIESILKNV